MSLLLAHLAFVKLIFAGIYYLQPQTLGPTIMNPILTHRVAQAEPHNTLCWFQGQYRSFSGSLILSNIRFSSNHLVCGQKPAVYEEDKNVTTGSSPQGVPTGHMHKGC